MAFQSITNSRRKVEMDEAGQILERNIPPLVDLYTHASNDRVATTVIDAVQALLDRLLQGQGPDSRAGNVSPPAGRQSAPSFEEPPAKKRRRREPEPADDIGPDQAATPAGATSARAPSTKVPSASATTSETAAATTRRSSKAGRPRGSARSSVQPPHKPSATLAISSDCGLTELSAIRTRFEAELLQISLASRDGSAKSHGFTEEEAADLTGFFFDDIMGPVSLQRLIGLVKSYTPTDGGDGESGDDDKTDAGALVRLKKIAHDKQAPLVIRRFFGTFHHHQRLQNTNAVMVHLQQIIDSRELLLNYERVRSHVEDRDVATLNYLTEKGMTVGVGRGWSTVAIDFLADRVQIKRSTFVNMCERAKGINTLVDHFGEGILPLLPPGSMHRLRRYGSQKMEPAYELLKKHVQSFQPMCDLTKDYVYAPFVNGDPTLRLDIFHLTEPKSHNFIDILTDAAGSSSSPSHQEVEETTSD